MAVPFLVFLLFTTITLSQIPTSSTSSTCNRNRGCLTPGSSLSVDNKDDILISPNGLFKAGFHRVGDNAYVFAVWISDQTTSGSSTVVWMANRDAPVNGKHSKLSLWKDGNLVLTDAGRYVIWSTGTKPTASSSRLRLHNTGNLVLYGGDGQPLWQSFDHPTDTLLPNQPLTKNTQLVSSTSSNNYSSGFYKLFFDHDSILRLLYDSAETTSAFWPHPSLRSWEAGRRLYIHSRRASLDSHGRFNSSDGFRSIAADFGTGPQRMMKIDVDGNLRVYSLVQHEKIRKWEVQWQALSHPCKIHGTCGPNSLCTYSQASGRKCSCLHGYKMANSEDWSVGCDPEFQLSTEDETDFIELRQVEFYGYDIRLRTKTTLDACKKMCLQDSTCKGFQFSWNDDDQIYYCNSKSSLHNGYQMGVNFSTYIKLPKRAVSSFYRKAMSQLSLSCPSPMLKPIIRSYEKKDNINPLGIMLVFGYTFGLIEIIFIVVFKYYTGKHSSTTEQSYIPTTTGFRQFTFRELKKASCNFSEEIGRGGACIVYKGRLSDNRVAAIKRLKNTNCQGEAEFQAEISTIGRVNHMNLIETWGYCVEGKHRLVVYEYMENGSLAKNLGLGKLDWATRFDIAIGTAKGLAYLHEECLEWVLHCDVKPHNILLDSNYNPKVADFGLSKLFDRSGIDDQSNFSMIRGTRGYMAPEWVFSHLPITSKVDVFSYGVVILEMITGKSPALMHQTWNEYGETETKLVLIDWVRERIQKLGKSGTTSWVEEIIDPSVSGEYDLATMEIVFRVALQCTEEDMEARPSMSQVVSMLLNG